MKTNTKKLLLAGSALIAVTVVCNGMAQAAPQNIGAGAPVAVTVPSDGVNFTADGTGTVADAGAINGDIVNGTAGHGTVEFAGAGSVTGTTGATAPGDKIKNITFQGDNTKTVTFTGAVNAVGLTFSSNGNAVFNANTAIDNAIALGTGHITVANGSTFTATAGITGGTGTVTIDGASTLAGSAALATLNKTGADDGVATGALTLGALNVNAGTLAINEGTSTVSGATAIGANTLTFGGASLASVSGVGGTLTLNKAGAQAVGAVGTTGNALNVLNLNGSGVKTLNAAIFAATTNIGAGVTANASASINGNTVFTGDGTLAFADNAGTTGSISASAANTGTVTFAGASAVDGAVGSGGAAVKQLTINGDNTKTVGFSGTVNAQNLGFTSSGIANLGGTSAIENVTKTNAGVATLGGAGTTTISTVTVSDGTLNITNTNASVTGATTIGANTLGFTGTSLTTVAGSGGTLNLNGADQAVGAIGSAGNNLAAVNLSGSGTKTLNGAVYATTTNINDSVTATATNTTFNSSVDFKSDGILNLANGTTVTGDVGATTAGQGTLNYTGPLNITGSLGRLKTLTVSDALTIGGNATAADTMNVGINNVTVTAGGTFTTTENTALTFRVNTPTTSGKITSAGNATVHADTAVNMIVDTNVYVAQGQEFTLIDGNDAGTGVATLNAGKLTTTNTALLHFKQKTTNTHDLVVFADRTMMKNVGVTPNNSAVGAMLDTLGGSPNADVNDLQVRLGKAMTNGEVNDILSKLVPDVSSGSIAAAVNVGGSTSNAVNTRVASVRNGEEYGSGMVAGDWANGGNFWGQIFGSSADQGRRNRVAGYDSETYGTVFGADTAVTDNFRAGLAFAYANTEVEGEDANRTDTEIDSYQVSLYGDLDLGQNYFLTGHLGYMYNDIDTVRHNVGGVAGNTARADFHSNQYIARAEAGRKYDVGHGLSLTPSALVNYNYIDTSDYTERGAGGLSLRNVDTDDMEILEFGVNLKAEGNFADHGGNAWKPNVHAGYRYDVIGDSVETSARLAGGGAAFRTEGFDPAQSTFNVGTGLKLALENNLEFTANYDYEVKEDYDAHTGYLRAGYKF